MFKTLKRSRTFRYFSFVSLLAASIAYAYLGANFTVSKVLTTGAKDFNTVSLIALNMALVFYLAIAAFSFLLKSEEQAG